MPGNIVTYFYEDLRRRPNITESQNLWLSTSVLLVARGKMGGTARQIPFGSKRACQSTTRFVQLPPSMETGPAGVGGERGERSDGADGADPGGSARREERDSAGG